MNVRRFLALAALAPLLLAGCGDDDDSSDPTTADLPATKAEFVTKVHDALDTEFADQLAMTGADPATIDKAIDSFLGCLYDDLKKDEDALSKVVDESGQAALADAVQKSMPKCGPKLTEAVVGAAAEG